MYLYEATSQRSRTKNNVHVGTHSWLVLLVLDMEMDINLPTFVAWQQVLTFLGVLGWNIANEWERLLHATFDSCVIFASVCWSNLISQVFHTLEYPKNHDTFIYPCFALLAAAGYYLIITYSLDYFSICLVHKMSENSWTCLYTSKVTVQKLDIRGKRINSSHLNRWNQWMFDIFA